MNNKLDPQIAPLLPQNARVFLGYLLGFGVSVGIGLAPLLGRANVPLFNSLLTLMPASLQNRLITLSTMVMSLVAVAVQFYTGVKASNPKLEHQFKRTLLFLVLSISVFIVVNTLVVERVELPKGRAESFVIGFSRLNIPPCNPAMSNKQCLKATTLSQEAIAQQWGDRQIKLAELLLQFSYLPIYACFGALVGLLVIAQTQASSSSRAE
jgi:hypothetical protein